MYNAEKYVGTCLDTITSSNLPQRSYEIIIVNDGSKDKGEDIVLAYANRLSNIVYLKQDNRGQSVARNYGIKEAQGEYIWCVDADDKLGANLSEVFKILCQYPELDILAIQLRKVTESDEFVAMECSQPTLVHNVLMSGREAVINGYCPSSICALITRRNLFIDNDIFFVPGITHQDVELTYRLVPKVSKILFSTEDPYLYILHNDSTSQSTKADKKIKYVKDEIFIIQSFMKSAEEVKNSDFLLYKTIYKRAKDTLFGLVYSLYKNKKEWNKIGLNKILVDLLIDAELYPLKGDFYSFKKKMVAKYILNHKNFLIFKDKSGSL